MSDFITFDSFEEMQEAVRRSAKYANERVTEEQKKLADGDAHYIVSWPDYPERIVPQPGCGELVLIYTEVESAKELEKKYRKKIDALQSKVKLTEEESEQIGEMEYELTATKNNLDNNLVFGNNFSFMCPEGELGSRNVVNAMEITKEDFETARFGGWHIMDNLPLMIKLPNEIMQILTIGLIG